MSLGVPGPIAGGRHTDGGVPVVPALEPVSEDLAADLAGTALALARRFFSGGTLWVVSPAWEPHAHRVADEFAHPAVAGARALPAFALVSSDPVSEARLAARSGDALVLIAKRDDATAVEIARRAPAWGVETVWIGCGARPEVGLADHVLWVDSDDPMLPATGRFVPLFHLLGELTHVSLENPGLLTVEPGCTDEVCVTCSDEGRLGEVVTPPAEPFGPALVRTAAGEEAVDVTLVGDVLPGDLLLVHAGSALTVIGGGR